MANNYDMGRNMKSAAGWLCENCGRANKNEANFCAGCGTARPISTTPVEMPEAPTAYEMPRSMPEKKNNTLRIVLIALIAVAVAAAAVFAGIKIFGGKGSDTGSSTDYDDSSAPAVAEETEGEDTGGIYAAYAEILRNNESAIGEYTDQYGVTKSCVAITDLSGDGVPELLFFSGDTESYLSIYTYLDGAATECSYDNSIIPSGTIDIPDDGLFIDTEVAAGTKYMIYTGSESGTFYIVYSMGDETMCYNSIKYTFDSTDSIRAVKIIGNKFGPNADYSDSIDEYFLNGSKVDASKGAAEFKADREAFNKLVMYSGYEEELKVFELTNSNSAAAMTLSEALNECDSRS